MHQTCSESIKKNNKTKKNKYIFILKNIDIVKVENKFGINGNQENMFISNNITKISDLKEQNTPEIISFLDETKKLHKCSVSMVNINNIDILYKENNYINCFWCRYKIPNNIKPIGCPVKHVQNQVVKSYYSEISKDNYTIKENITQTKIKCLNTEDKRLNVIKKNYYVTDGAFCSFNCCKSYICDNKKNPLYNLSEMLLLKMYKEIFPSTNIIDIQPAPHWRKLKEYGGDKTIKEFRDSFNKVEYKNFGFTSLEDDISDYNSNDNFPLTKSMGMLFEEKLKF